MPIEKDSLEKFVEKYSKILQIEEKELREIMENIDEGEYPKIKEEINEWLILRHS